MSEKMGNIPGKGESFTAEIEAKFQREKRVERQATKKMKNDFINREVKKSLDDIFDNKVRVDGIDGFRLIGPQVNLDKEAKFLNKRPIELWKDFYGWGIGSFIENKLGKTRDLIRELEKINDDLSSPKEGFEKGKIPFLFNFLINGYTENTLPESYLDLRNKIVGLQTNSEGEDWNEFNDYHGVGLGSYLIEDGNDFSPIKKGDSYAIKVLNKNNIFEYWGNIDLIHDVIKELNENYKLDKDEIFKVLSGETPKKEITFISNKVNDLLDEGSVALAEVRKVKEHDLIGVEISKNLAELLKKIGIGKVKNGVGLLEKILEKQKEKYEKQNKRKESFKDSIFSKLDLERAQDNWQILKDDLKKSKDELDKLKNGEESKSIQDKLIIYKTLDKIADGIAENTGGLICINKIKKINTSSFNVVGGELNVEIKITTEKPYGDKLKRLEMENELEHESITRTKRVQDLIDSLKLTKEELGFFVSDDDKKILSFDEALRQVINKRKNENRPAKEEIDTIWKIKKLNNETIPGLEKEIGKLKPLKDF